MQSLELFFDYTCPFAYLGVSRVQQLGIPVTYRPILLGGVFQAQGTPQNLAGTLGPAKAAHNVADMQRWAKRYGMPLRMPEGHPMRSVEALRATLAMGNDPKVIAGFYRAYCAENRPISSREVIEEVCGRMPDLDAHKEDLRARTEEAVRRGVFGVPTFVVDEKELYWGQDRLPFVLGERRRDPERGPKTIEVFWDFSSPFAYLAATQVERLAARTGTKVIWSPILLGGLFRAVGTVDVPLATFSPAKQEHVMNDLKRWAAYWDVPFRFPTHFPTRSLDALRCYCALPESERGAFRDRVFRAYWAEDQDIASRELLGSLVGAEVLAKSASEEVKAALRASTERAAARGVFGVPTFLVDDQELYWGQDRLEMAFTGP